MKFYKRDNEYLIKGNVCNWLIHANKVYFVMMDNWIEIDRLPSKESRFLLSGILSGKLNHFWLFALILEK